VDIDALEVKEVADQALCETALVCGHGHGNEEIARPVDHPAADYLSSRDVTLEGLVPGRPDGRS
jgi:hypothetical protein